LPSGWRNRPACWPPLGLSLYVVHVIAIACGREPPYVESDYDRATSTLGFYYVSGFGLLLGVGLRNLCRTIGWPERRVGPPVRFFPRSGLQWLFLGACLALGAGVHELARGSRTVYSSRYDESRFLRVTVGMSAEEVESLVGPPIFKSKVFNSRDEVWHYSQGKTELDDYWRRWIAMSDGKVSQITCDYWYD